MAKKYVNYRVGGTPEKKDENYTVWSNDLLTKLIASKTVIEPNKSTLGHRPVSYTHLPLPTKA